MHSPESKIKVIIADDEPAARDAIEVLLRQKPRIEILAKCCDGNEAVSAILHHRPQLVLLDIQMPEMDGFEVLEAIRDTFVPVFIFVTAYDQFALKAFEKSACDYLLKPYDDERFFQSLEKAGKAIRANKAQQQLQQLDQLLGNVSSLPAQSAKGNSYPKRLSIKNNRRISFLETDSILSVESQGNFVKFHTQKGPKIGNYTFKQLQCLLDPQKFVRIHKSFMINMDFIDSLEPHFNGDYYVYMKDGCQLKLSRNYKSALDQIVK